MTDASGDRRPSPDDHWFLNLIVCTAGSFTTIVAMTLLLPFLPLYVEEIGVKGHAAIMQWSGVAYGAAFFTAALTAPLWGRLGDRYGRKLMLIRASLGMAIAMSLTGMAQSIEELVAVRLLTGLLGGYASGSMILVAAQTPKAKSGWALGVLSSGILAGNLVGPLIGGALPPLIGIRATFWLSGAAIFLSFLATTFLLREAPRPREARASRLAGLWACIPDRRPVVAMLATGLLLTFALTSIEPIITVYVGLFAAPAEVTVVAGLAMSAGALGGVLSSARLGRLADRIGYWRVVVLSLTAAALLLVPQAFVDASWQFVALRFFMGAALGGLAPGMTAVIRHSAPEAIAGSLLGWSVSAQYVGQVAGPLAGGYVGGHIGIRAVFLATAVLMAAGALANFAIERASRARNP
ncbi:MAG TPA: MFS transporter [Roseiarcus sp.]|nr:MFS transporter [Roseiarcus sp.]